MYGCWTAMWNEDALRFGKELDGFGSFPRGNVMFSNVVGAFDIHRVTLLVDFGYQLISTTSEL